MRPPRGTQLVPTRVNPHPRGTLLHPHPEQHWRHKGGGRSAGRLGSLPETEPESQSVENTRRLFQYKTPTHSPAASLQHKRSPCRGGGRHPSPPAAAPPGPPRSRGSPAPLHPPQPAPSCLGVGDTRGPRPGRFLPAPGGRLGGGSRGGSGRGAGIPTPQQAGLVSAGGSRAPSFPTRFYSLRCPIAAGRAPGGAGAEHTCGLSSQPPSAERGGGQLGETEPPAPVSPRDPLLSVSPANPPLGCPPGGNPLNLTRRLQHRGPRRTRAPSCCQSWTGLPKSFGPPVRCCGTLGRVLSALGSPRETTSQLGTPRGNFVLEKANAGVGDVLRELWAAQVTRVLQRDGGGCAAAGDRSPRTPPVRLHLVLGFSSPTAHPQPHGTAGLPSALPHQWGQR